MKNKLTNNWGLKLGSLLFAFFLWIIVTNLNDPVTQYRIYNVPVRFTNTDVVTSDGKTYEVVDGSDVIDVVTVSAARSVVDSLSEQDIVAVADFNNLTKQNTIDIQLSTNKYNNDLESIKGSIDVVTLNIENLKTKTYALAVETVGNPNDGYIIGDVTLGQNQVRVSGPESVVDRIDKVVSQVAVSGFTQDISTDADIELLDEEGNEIISDSLNYNIKTVKVNVAILKTKLVGLNLASSGTPAEGYEATGEIISNPSEILVAGKSSSLDNIENINIPSDVINITGQTGDMMAIVDVSDYLPSGISLADPDFNGNISVTAFVEKTVDKRLNFDVDDINWTNVPEGYVVELVDPEESFGVILNGLRVTMNNIEKDDVLVTADLSDILEQTDTVGSLYHTNLKFVYDNGSLATRSPVQVWFKLNKE